MRNRILRVAISAAAVALAAATTSPAALSAPLAAPVPVAAQETVTSSSSGTGPEVRVETPSIQWGTRSGDSVPYSWSSRVENPNDRAVLVKVRLSFVNEQGTALQEDWVAGQIGPNESAILQQRGEIDAMLLEDVAEARGVPEASWGDEPYKIRTLAAFVDGLQRLEVFFVLEDWLGRPVTAAGTVDLYIVERERLRAEFDGGGMSRRLTTLYARRFNIGTGDFSRRRIGFMNTDYSPPAVTLGPIHYSIFDHEPRGDEGLVRVVFRSLSGVEVVAEDRVFF